MAPALQDDINRFYRLFNKFSSESKIVSIATIALVVSALSLLMSWMAVYDAVHVKIEQHAVLESNVDLKKEIRLLQMKMDRYGAELHVNGD